MGEVAQKNYQGAANFARPMADWLKNLLMAIAEFLEKHAEYAPQRALAKWIKEKGSVCAYQVSDNAMRQLKTRLSEEGIAYVELAYKNHLLIKTPDLKKVYELNREILMERGNYFNEIPADEYENVIAKSERVKNKNVLSLHGLDAYEMEVIKNKCNAIKYGFSVGTKKEPDGKYTITIMMPSIIKKRKETTKENDRQPVDFCKAFLQAKLSLYANEKLKRERLDRDEKLDKLIMSDKAVEGVMYVTSLYKPNRFVEINKNGLEVYDIIRDENGKVKTENQIARIERENPSYRAELQRYTDTIFDKTVLYSAAELKDHIEITENKKRASWSKDEVDAFRKSQFNRKAVEKIDEMIKSQNPNILNEEPQRAFALYESLAAEIIECTFTDKEQDMFDKKDIETLRNLTKTYGVREFMQDYLKAKDKIKDLNKVEVHEARRVKEKDLVKDSPSYTRETAKSINKEEKTY